MKRIAGFLSNSPSYSDYKTNLRAGFLHTALIVSIVTSLLIALINLRQGAINLSALLVVFSIYCGLGIVLNKRGKFTLAAYLFILLLLVVLDFNLLDGAALHDPGVATFPIFILLTGFLLGNFGAWLSLGTSLISIIALYAGHQVGWFELNRSPSLNRLLTLLAIYLSSGGITLGVLRSFRRANRKLEERQVKLHQSHEMLSTAEQVAGVGSWEWDLASNKVAFSKNALKLYGIKPDEYDGKYETAFKAFHPEDRPIVQKNIEEMLAEKTPRVFEYRIIKADGDIRVIEGTNRMEFDKAGEIIRLVGHIQDITERKQAQAALLESRERYRILSKSAFEGIGFHVQGKITDGNDQMASILGYEISELIGTLVSKLVHPEDREFVENQIKNGSDEPYEHRIIRKDGTARFLEVRGKSMQIDGQASRVTVLRDITERKRAENLFLALNRAALAMENALTPDETFEAVAQELHHLGFSSILFPLDESRTKLLTNYVSYDSKMLEALEKMAGFKLKEFSINIDSMKLFKNIIQEKKAVFVEETDDYLRQALPAGMKKLAPQIIKMLNITKSIPAPLIVDGRAIGIFSVLSDDLTEDDIPAIIAFADQMAAAFTKTRLIEELEGSLVETNRLAAERERLFEEVQLRQRKLQELTIQLASLQESEKEHIAKELHDRVGQSLTALNISLSHSKNLIGSAQIDEAIERIDRAQELVEKTTQQVRDVMAELRPAVLDEYGLFAALNWQAAQHQKLTNMATIVQGSELKPRLDPDAEIALLRIVQEALTNAARYAEATKITISLATAEDSILLMVEDNGIGFDPSSQKEGWGLVIMQERATAVNGNMEVKSSPGKGTRILVSVPKET